MESHHSRRRSRERYPTEDVPEWYSSEKYVDTSNRRTFRSGSVPLREVNKDHREYRIAPSREPEVRRENYAQDALWSPERGRSVPAGLVLAATIGRDRDGAQGFGESSESSSHRSSVELQDNSAFDTPADSGLDGRETWDAEGSDGRRQHQESSPVDHALESPEWYAYSVADSKITLDELKYVASAIRTQSLGWVMRFVEAQGRIALRNEAQRLLLTAERELDHDVFERSFFVQVCLMALERRAPN